MGMCAENETEEEKPAKKPRDNLDFSLWIVVDDVLYLSP